MREKDENGNVSATVARAARSTVNSPDYTDRRLRILQDFVQALRKVSPKYDHLLELSDDMLRTFRINSTHLEKVFILLSGPEEKTMKVNLLNKMLIDWVGNLERKCGDKKFHKTSSINVMICRFFAAAKDHFDWHFTTSDFQFDGGYNGFFRNLCKERLKENVSKNRTFCAI